MDQPADIGALQAAVAQSAGVAMGYLPGWAMRRIVDLHPSQAKTDARDAAIIAEAARPEMMATSNRIRGLLTQIHPALERAQGPHSDHSAAADLLTRYPIPAALKSAGRGQVKARLKKYRHR